jgi:hypothetical protein
LKEPPKRPSVTFEQLCYSNMLAVDALVGMPTEKGVRLLCGGGKLLRSPPTRSGGLWT